MGIIIDLNNELTAINLMAGTFTSSGNGSGVDLRGYQGKLKVTLNSGAGGGADHTLDVKLQESDDNSTWSDISGAAFTQVTNAGPSLQSMSVDPRATKRYIRAVRTIGGTSPSFGFAVTAVGQKQIR